MRRSGLIVVALALLGAVPAPAAAAAKAGPSRPQPPVPRGKRSGLDKRVATLTKALGLDAGQQAALRKVLQDQREQVQRIWAEESLSSPDRIGATRKVSMQTADRIRALLNEDQRKKYDPPPPADTGNKTRDAHVEDWMSGARKR